MSLFIFENINKELFFIIYLRPVIFYTLSLNEEN